MSENNLNINNIPKDAKKMSKEMREVVTQGVKDGTIEHKQINQGIKNLIPLNQRTKEERTEIARKGALALKEIRGERKNARQILEDVLPLYAKDSAIDKSENIPEDIKEIIKKNNIRVTQYDLVMLSMLNRAINGDYKAAEYIRDTFGDKPINENHNINENITEADRELIKNLSKRMGLGDVIDVNTGGNT